MNLENFIKKIYSDLEFGYPNIAIKRLIDSWETEVAPHLDIYYQEQKRMELVTISQRYNSIRQQDNTQNSELIIIEGNKIVRSILYQLEQIKDIKSTNQNQLSTLQTISLNKEEIDILAYMNTDVQAYNRGVWLYPFQQQLTYRGFTDSQANSLLTGLKLKKMIEYLEIDNAPLYKITDLGVKFLQDNQNLIPNIKSIYKYHIRLSGNQQKNEVLLNEIKKIEFVQSQTRFINENQEDACRIAVFAYKEINKKFIDQIAAIVKRKILSFEEIN